MSGQFAVVVIGMALIASVTPYGLIALVPVGAVTFSLGYFQKR